MHIELIDGRYVATCALSDRDKLREAGFIFDRLALRKWYTTDWRKCAVFVDQCVGAAYDVVRSKLDEHEEALEASYSMYAEADIPRPHLVNAKGEVLDYLPYQKAGILYAAERNDTLIADSPGLGKTIQAIGFINYMGIRNGIIVCPSSLKLNWLREMTKWLVDKDLTVGVAYGSTIPDTDFIIINYDILKKNRDFLWDRHWDFLVCDEAQYLANSKSGRTESVFGEYKFDYKTKSFRRKMVRGKGLIRAEWRMMLTGTPMMKKPHDMWPIIRDFDPRGLGKSYEDFCFTYCDGHQGPFGIVADGGSNLDELNEKLRKGFMIRRLKKHVLAELPEKTREVVVLPAEGLKKLIKTERDKFVEALAMLDAANTGIEYQPKIQIADLDPGHVLDTMTIILKDFDREGVDDLSVGEVEPGFAAYSEARRDLALSKVPMAVEHIKRLVDAGEKVIAFAIHKDVVKAVREEFPTAARIVGGMTPKQVEAEKLRFQGNEDDGIEPEEDCRVIICNLKAGGVGHTLTEATVVIFIEVWSVPGDMEQCEDRAHRFGLKHNVLIQYLVVDGSMDAATIQTLVDRISIIEQAVDGIDPITGKETKA